MSVTVLQGDAVAKLRELPADSVHCCVTSPPYWNLRDYGTADWDGGDAECDHLMPPRGGIGSPKQSTSVGTHDYQFTDLCAKCGARRIDQQIGLEATPAEWVAKLVSVFAEVRRVLRDDATLWVNCGDAYAGSWGAQGRNGVHASPVSGNQIMAAQQKASRTGSIPDGTDYKPGDRIMLATMLAEALRANGWWHRDTIIWAKTSPMPESVSGWRWEQHRIKAGKDDAGRTIWLDCPGCAKCLPNDGLVLRKGSWRHTNSYEMVFQFAKTAEYFGDGDAVKEAASVPAERFVPANGSNRNDANVTLRNDGSRHGGGQLGTAGSRNPRNVWTLGPDPLVDEHYAAFPREIPRRAILASTSAKGCCPACGAPWARVVERDGADLRDDHLGRERVRNIGGRIDGYTRLPAGGVVNGRSETTGWRPTCTCPPAEPIPAAVLDPFGGSGTTGVVADELGRDAILVELSPVFAAMCERRVAKARARRLLGDAPRYESLPGQASLFDEVSL